MAVPPEVAQWVREAAPELLPVEIVAHRTLKMYQVLVEVGEMSSETPEARPIGLDYCVLASNEVTRASVLPDDEQLIAEAYRECKHALRRYIPDLMPPEHGWEALFESTGSHAWFTQLLSLWVTPTLAERSPESGAAPRIYDGAVDITAYDRGGIGDDEDRLVAFQVNACEPSDGRVVWTLAVLGPSDSQQDWLAERGWQFSGQAAWCEFPTAEPLVSTLGVALPALAGPVSPQSWVRVLIGGMAALEDAAYWAQMPYLESIVLDLDPAAYPAAWPGSDWDNLEKVLPSGLPESQRGNFSARGVLVEPVKVLATDGIVAVMRDAGFVVTLDLGNVPATWFPVTVHPRTTRTLVV